ncbi:MULTISPECIES: hypothetical protein [Paenibacillus]|uniref:hypothetical protein n=1 Tax=Paenibacillus TaxID=44249 RepID=UPI002FE0AD66
MNPFTKEKQALHDRMAKTYVVHKDWLELQERGTVSRDPVAELQNTYFNGKF